MEKKKCCGGRCKNKIVDIEIETTKIMASELIMKEDNDSLEKTTAELNIEVTEEEEREKIEELLRETGIGNNRQSGDSTQ